MTRGAAICRLRIFAVDATRTSPGGSFVITAGLLLDPEGLLGTKLVLGPRT